MGTLSANVVMTDKMRASDGRESRRVCAHGHGQRQEVKNQAQREQTAFQDCATAICLRSNTKKQHVAFPSCPLHVISVTFNVEFPQTCTSSLNVFLNMPTCWTVTVLCTRKDDVSPDEMKGKVVLIVQRNCVWNKKMHSLRWILLLSSFAKDDFNYNQS